MKTIKSLGIALLAGAAGFAGAQTSRPISVVVDGSPVVFTNQQPMMSDARVLVPLRGVFEKLGASVGWDPATQSITAHTRRTTVKLTIGQLDAAVNNQPVHMDIPATLVSGTTMVPLRFVSEALGAEVGWNPAAYEVDIKSREDYGFPKGHERDRDRDRDRDRRPVPPPPVAPPPVPYIDFAPDSVIPFILQTRLNSGNAQVGDQFTATIDTHGRPDYYGLPANSVAFGTVAYVRHQHGRDPGVLELKFDHLTLPNGRNLRLDGRIFDIHTPGVTRLPNGTVIAQGLPRHDHSMFTGYGPGQGVIVGVMSNHVVVDAEIGRLLGQFARPEVRTRPATNVELRPGTPIAIRLYSDFRFRRDFR